MEADAIAGTMEREIVRRAYRRTHPHGDFAFKATCAYQR
jgi:hypothetical protein